MPWIPWKPDEDAEPSETGVTDGCEQTYGSW